MKLPILLTMAIAAFSLHAQTPDFPGMQHEREVLKGVLYRAGGPGGRTDASDNSLESMCNAGIRTVLYLYPDQGFDNRGPHKCSNGASINYAAGYFRFDQVYDSLKYIYQAAIGNSGPVLVHCWNGWHAAGELSAKALMQFCGWSGDRAADYWAQTIGDHGNLGKYKSILNRIRDFKPDAAMRLPEETREAICP